jgi:hypothetical protein
VDQFYFYLNVTVPADFVGWKTLWWVDETVLLLAEVALFL